MIILGIDPGLTRLGFGVIRSEGARGVGFEAVGIFNSKPEDSVDVRIGSLAQRIELLIDTHKPDKIAIERVFAQSNLRSVMGVAQISGVVMALAFERNIPIAFHTPSEVKLAVTGSGRAEKAQVGFMVAKILKLSEVPKPADAADALAIAICSAWNLENIPTGNPQTAAQKTWLSAVAKSKQSKG